MDTAFESFGDWLKYWRKHSGLTQQDIADKLNRTPALISNWERGVLHGESGAVALPSAEQARTIAKMFQRPVREALKMIGIDVEDAHEQPGSAEGSFAQRQTALAQFLLDNFTDTERERAFAILAATFHGADVLIPGAQYLVEEVEAEADNRVSKTLTRG